MIVVDASVIADFVLAIPPYADIVAAQLQEHDGAIHAPHLLDAEVGHTIRRYAMSKQITRDRVGHAIGYLESLPITRHGHTHLIRAAMAHAANLSLYDALYLVLAGGLGATLLTRDAAFTLPARRAKVPIVVL